MRVAVVAARAADLLNFRKEMLRSMVARGHHVLALAPEDDPRVRAALEVMGVSYATVPLRRTGMNPLRDVVTLVTLTRIFREYHADVVFLSAAKPVVYGLIAARLAGVPRRAAMISGVGSALGGGSGLRGRALSSLLRGLYGVALRQAHIVYFQNPDDERLFRSMGIVGDRHRVVPINGSGVDLEHFSPAPLPPGPITFLMIGRLLRGKGVGEYVEAARLVRSAHPQVQIQLLGPLDPNPSGISARDLEVLIGEGIVDYLGSTFDVRPFIARAHVCVLPSYYGEGVPHSLLEGMSMGRAVLTTDVPGCRETVQQRRNGLLVAPRDADALAEGMLQMLSEPERLEPMGHESRVIAEERFDVHSVNRVILGAMGLD